MFKQYAKGSFSCAVSGDHHCGPDDTSPKRFDFEVYLRYPSGALDQRGFLLDNLDFQSYFNAISATDVSCERLARQACEYFKQAAAGRAVHIEVSIWGIPGAVKVSCSWPDEEQSVVRQLLSKQVMETQMYDQQ